MTAVAATPRTTLTASVIICCYTLDRWARLIAAIESVRSQTRPPDEIAVVVDHCPPLLERLSTYPGVRTVANGEARGLSGARNTGVAVSRSDVVAFLDDDAVADPDWLQQLLTEYDDKRVAGVGGHVEPFWEAGRPRWFPHEFDWVVGCSHPGLPGGVAPVRNFVGANMSFRRDVVRELGGFHGGLGRVGTRPVGCEETEFCIRLATEYPDAILQYRPDATVGHHVPAERGSWSYFRRRCFAEGRSKATVSRLRGSEQALADERSYVRRVLPRGFVGALAERDVPGLLRAAALVSGLGATCGGYAAARIGRAVRTHAAQFAPLVVALLLWAISLRGVDLRGMSDLGLVSVLPVTYWVALAILVGSTAVLIHRDHSPEPVLAAYLVGVIAIVHATPTILYGSLRYGWAWKHVGIVDYILRHGAVDPHISSLTAYHAWPGFFALNALLVRAAGLPSALSYAAWGPLAFALLALVPLRILFGALVADRRQVWLALMIFYLGNWVGQEYFSPQAFGYVLHLVVLAVCLRWLPARNPRPHRLFGAPVPGRTPATGPTRRALIAVVVVLMLAIVSSHQLTPFMLLTALTVLVVGRHTGPAWLPPLLAGLTVGWISLMAMGFLRQNLYWIVQSIGKPAANTQTTFVDLSQATFEQRLVDYTDRGLTATIGLLAVMGYLRLRRRRAPRRVPALLAASPVPLLLVNNYSGEMLFRVYLFAVPFLALLVAGTVYPAATRRRLSVVLPVALTLLLAAQFSVAYYGKERMNYFTPDEVAASRWLYDHAPTGSLVVGATAGFPWAFTHYESYEYVFLEGLPAADREALSRTPEPVVHRALGQRRPAFVILTRSEAVSARYTGVLPAGALPAITSALTHTPGYQVVFRNRDATIIEAP